MCIHKKATAIPRFVLKKNLYIKAIFYSFFDCKKNIMQMFWTLYRWTNVLK